MIGALFGAGGGGLNSSTKQTTSSGTGDTSIQFGSINKSNDKTTIIVVGVAVVAFLLYKRKKG